MSKKSYSRALMGLLGTGAMTLVLSGCDLSYLANSDRITQGAGNGVKANLEGQTVNPSSDQQYDVSGLGKNGSVISAPPQNP